MNILCPRPPSLCNDPADPLANISSEAPDGLDLIGWSYGKGGGFGFSGSGRVQVFPPDYLPPTDDVGESQFPPLGSLWLSNWCNGSCVSDVSQDEADLCAHNAMVECQSFEWPETVPNPDPATSDEFPFIAQPRTIFWNQSQFCTINCGDGTPFTWTVQANKVSAFSQLEANLLAYSRACSLARTNVICFGALSSDTCCLQEFKAITVSLASRNLPLTITFASGALPPGMSFNQTGPRTLTIDGVPTTSGEFTFELTAFDSAGNSMSKEFTITTFGISNSPPDGTVGGAYSFQFTTSGMTAPVTYSVTGGGLPSGLSLSSTGQISGTPTTVQNPLVEVRATDASGKVCENNWDINITNPCIPDIAPGLDSTVGGMSNPLSVVYASASNRLFVREYNGGSNQVRVLNGDDNSLVGIVALSDSRNSKSMAYDPVGGTVWVLSGNSTILRVNENTLAQTSVTVPSSAPWTDPYFQQIQYVSGQLEMWVSTDTTRGPPEGGACIMVFNCSSFSHVDTLDADAGVDQSGYDCFALAYNSTSGRVFMSVRDQSTGAEEAIQVWSASGRNRLLVVSYFAYVATYGIFDMQYNSDHNRLVIANWRTGAGGVMAVILANGTSAAYITDYNPGKACKGVIYNTCTHRVEIVTGVSYSGSSAIPAHVDYLNPTTLALISSVVVGQNLSGVLAFNSTKARVVVCCSDLNNLYLMT